MTSQVPLRSATLRYIGSSSVQFVQVKKWSAVQWSEVKCSKVKQGFVTLRHVTSRNVTSGQADLRQVKSYKLRRMKVNEV